MSTAEQQLQWLDLHGKWSFLEDGSVQSLGSVPGQPPPSYNVALCDQRLVQSTLSVSACFPVDVGEARLVFGYNAETGHHHSRPYLEISTKTAWSTSMTSSCLLTTSASRGHRRRLTRSA